MSFVLISTFFSLALATAPQIPPVVYLGVVPTQKAEVERHIVEIDGQLGFACSRGGRVVPLKAVNDDYCDCIDTGLDERGTGACSGVIDDEGEDDRFWCENRLAVPKFVYHSRVRDGICDCCDGADETVVGAGTPCPNTCEEEGRVLREEARKRREEFEKGLAARQSLETKGRDAVQTWKKEIDALDIEVGKLMKRKEVLEETKERLRKENERRRKRDEKRRKEEQAVEEPTAASTRPPANVSPTVPAVPSEVPAAPLDVAMEPPVALEAEHAEEPKISEYSKWMAKDADAVLEEGKPLGVTQPPMPPSEEEESKEIEEDEEDDVTPAIPNVKPTGLIPRLLSGITGMWNRLAGTRRSQFERVNSEFSKVSRDLGAATERRDKFKRQLAYNLGHSFQFASLVDECYSLPVDKYTYEACLFNEAHQLEGGSRVGLGRYESFHEPPHPEEPAVMKFTNGVTCWNGPPRSLTLSMHCGPEAKLLEVTEIERCVYSARMTTPAACRRVGEVEGRHSSSLGDKRSDEL